MSPYRTIAVPPTPRRVPLYVRALAWATSLLSSPWESRWYRRARGGAWELREHWTLPGLPQFWAPANRETRPSFRVVDREVWP